MSERSLFSFRERRPWTTSSFILAFLAGCGAAGPEELDELTGTDEAALEAAAQPEDGLAEAFETFARNFADSNFDSNYVVGYGFHAGMNTERVVGPNGLAASGQVLLNMNTGRVHASLRNLSPGGTYDLWLVKNVAGGSRSVLPEAGDRFFKVGRFQGSGDSRELDVSLGVQVNFDLDLVVVTRGNRTPAQSRIAVGERTILEKRLFRFRRSEGLDPVNGALANNVETADPLVARGAQLFFNETFGGNGRTCGTCHRAENNLTIDPAFIATLPASDPLFVAETNPLLANLENPALLRERGLILENVDGFDDPTRKFVMRSVPHTLSLGVTNGMGLAAVGPPDHRLGWGGDGGPARSTLQQFSFGAVMQHFTKTLERRPGVDFRVPTQEELDALEAFQLFTGRQKSVDFLFSRFPTNPGASNGGLLFQTVGCTSCHDDLFDFGGGFNGNFDTGVANLTPDLIFDDGFGTPGDQTFNVPPLAEAADTPPFFHNNAVATIEDAVGFYFSPTFQASPSAFFVARELATEGQRDIAAFLRVVNASTNLSQVRKRIAYVETHRSPGNTDLLTIALADARDARVVLADRNLNPQVRTQIASAETILRNAQSQADNRRPNAMRRALALIDQAASGLFTSAPTGGTGGTGGVGGGAGSPAGGTGVGGTFPAGGTSAGGVAGAGGSVIAGGTGGSAVGGTASGGRPGAGGSVIGGTSAGGTSAGGTSTGARSNGGVGGSAGS
ncbi:MAG TPA: hypothetical protein VFZ53_01960 [Polyangiaceae bacterium]